MPRRERSFPSRNSPNPAWEPSKVFFCNGGGVPGNALHSIDDESNSTSVSRKKAVYQNEPDIENLIAGYAKPLDYYKLKYEDEFQECSSNVVPPRRSYLMPTGLKIILLCAMLCCIALEVENRGLAGKSLFPNLGNKKSINISDPDNDNQEGSDGPQEVLRNTAEINNRTIGFNRESDGRIHIEGPKSISLKNGNKHTQASGAELLLAPAPPLPNPELPGYKNTWEPHESKDDVPVFWHVPKAGGSTIKDIVGACHGRTITNENGVLYGHDEDTELEVITINGQGDTRFVNVDTTTVEGIQRAKQMGLGSSSLAELIITPYIFETGELFSEGPQKGRLFATFREPISRAVSMFKYLQYADWEPTYNPEFKSWSLEQYARSEQIENNWMTRHLSNELTGELTSAHLQVALDVLRRKFLVGLVNRMDESMERFEAYFGWRYIMNPTAQETCRESLFTIGTNANRNKIKVPSESDIVYDLIARQNVFDIELYKYIEMLFEEQEEFVKDIPKDYRFVNAECNKCEED